MKNIIKTSIIFSVFIALVSCAIDKDPIPSANGFELRKEATVVSPTILLDQNGADVFAILKWDRSNNGIPTESKYSILVSDHDADPNFEDAIESTFGLVLEPDARRDTLKVGDFNTLINQLPTFNCNQMNIDVRIKSKLGVSSNALYQYSNPVTFSVKGFPKSKPIIAFATSSALAGDSSKLASSDYKTFTDYEGYLYLEAGTYKFYRPDSCGDFANPIAYGLSGASTGSLTLDGSTGFTVAIAGHYYIKANLSDTGAGSLTYSIAAFNATSNTFGLFGSVKGSVGFANTTPMNYDPITKKWSLTLDLINGKKFGFKTNNTTSAAILIGNGTAINLTEGPLTTNTISPLPSNIGEGSITAPGVFVNNTTKTKYAIEVDLSKPRNYTYKLSVIPN